MSGMLIAAMFVVVVLVIWVALQTLSTQKKSETAEKQMSELRRDLQTVATAQAQAAGQITTLTSSVTTRSTPSASRSPMAWRSRRTSPPRARPPCATS